MSKSSRKHSAKRVDDILVDDCILLERSKQWATLFEKYAEDDVENSIKATECQKLFEDDTDEEESVEVSEFEDNNTEDDPNFNVKHVLNQTKKVIETRKKKWNETGIDTVMDSFCLKRIDEKVSNWLRNNSDYFSNCYKPRANCNDSGHEIINKFELKKNQILLENGSDSDSLQSVDTAKYILSNRKRKKTKVTTMTIKSYCFSQKRAKKGISHLPRISEVENINFENANLSDEVFSDSQWHIPHQNNEFVRSKSVPDVKSRRNINSNGKKLKRKLTNKRESTRLSTSSSSSNTSDNKSVRDTRHNRSLKCNMKNIVNKSARYKLSSESSDSSIAQFNLNTDKSSRKTKTRSKNISISKNLDVKTNEETSTFANFKPVDIINSTALKSHNSMINNKEKFATGCEKIQKTSNTTCSSFKSQGRKSILVYTPKKSASVPKNLKNGKLRITEEHLSKAIGLEMVNKYFGNAKDFVHECDPNSQILFIPPDENITTSDSETDILEALANRTGKLIEIVHM